MHVREFGDRKHRQIAYEEREALMEQGYCRCEISDMELPSDYVEGDHVIHTMLDQDTALEAGDLINVTDFRLVARAISLQDSYGTRTFRDVFNDLAEPVAPLSYLSRFYANPSYMRDHLWQCYIRTQSLVEYSAGDLYPEKFAALTIKAKLLVKGVVDIEFVDQELAALQEDADAKSKAARECEII